MLDAYPDAEPYKPYTCTLCKQKCGGIVNDKYCIKCVHDMDTAQAIFNSDKSPLDFMVQSNGSVRMAPNACERCGKKFRFWRKEHGVFDKTEHEFHSWKLVCIDCINTETDAF